MNNKPNFEEYLKDIHARDYIGTDDNMSDGFESWLEDQGIDEIVQMANNYAVIYSKAVITNVIGKLMKEIHE